jgi:hypothetical protein
MEAEVVRIAATLASGGIRMDVLQPNSHTEVFVAELPNKKQYLFTRAGLLKLGYDGKLNMAGIEEFGVTR